MERIEALKLFLNQAKAAKFAIPLSIREGTLPGTVTIVETKWNKGRFDLQGEIAETIRALFP